MLKPPGDLGSSCLHRTRCYAQLSLLTFLGSEFTLPSCPRENAGRLICIYMVLRCFLLVCKGAYLHSISPCWGMQSRHHHSHLRMSRLEKGKGKGEAACSSSVSPETPGTLKSFSRPP